MMSIFNDIQRQEAPGIRKRHVELVLQQSEILDHFEPCHGIVTAKHSSET
jgi:hypothetical protein